MTIFILAPLFHWISNSIYKYFLHFDELEFFYCVFLGQQEQVADETVIAANASSVHDDIETPRAADDSAAAPPGENYLLHIAILAHFLMRTRFPVYFYHFIFSLFLTS